MDLYLRLPYAGEVERIAGSIVGDRILELGCGVGRITRRLVERGYRVTAVDNSAEMLAHVPGEATKVRADIEGLALGRTFDTVLLASLFINIPDRRERSAILATCQRHLGPNGVLIFERYDPAWFASATPGRVSAMGDVEVFLDRIERGPDRVEMSIRYRCGEDQWRHHFSTEPLDDDQVSSALAEAGFGPPEWIDRWWGRAAPAA